ncbi:Putative transcriptional regulator, LysR family [Mycobacteroides abscessus subsp. abscessus]|nr:Putative transcriptional regulator, LysR family [Mycobacteroides abscessus subsp. abscessus]
MATSPPAVSRSLGRLRRITGDALLVRAGQGLVPTPRAVQIRDELGGLLRRADQILRPGAEFDPGKLQRTFIVQAAELFLTALAVPLLERLRHDAPGVNVVFAPEAREDTGALRRGDIDIELGSLDHLDPETRHTPVAMLPMVGVAAQDHPLFEGPIDAGTFATYGHISVSRRGKLHGPIDEALARHGLRRRVPVVVPSHTSAMLLARSSRLIALTVAGSVSEGISARRASARSHQRRAVPGHVLPVALVGAARDSRIDRCHCGFRYPGVGEGSPEPQVRRVVGLSDVQLRSQPDHRARHV